jgi:methionine aminopeptidase
MVHPQDVSLYYDGEVMSVNSGHGVTLEIPGFHADLNETYPVGRIDEDSKRLIRTARRCLDESIKICKPGTLIRDIGKVMWVQNWNIYGL